MRSVFNKCSLQKSRPLHFSFYLGPRSKNLTAGRMSSSTSSMYLGTEATLGTAGKALTFFLRPLARGEGTREAPFGGVSSKAEQGAPEGVAIPLPTGGG